jgi:hypothetical protein
MEMVEGNGTMTVVCVGGGMIGDEWNWLTVMSVVSVTGGGEP